jgi:hypothetical protein
MSQELSGGWNFNLTDLEVLQLFEKDESLAFSLQLIVSCLL